MLGVIVVGIVQKGGILIEYAGRWSSKDPGVGSNHGAGNRPKNVGVIEPECWKRILTTCGIEICNEEKRRVA